MEARRKKEEELRRKQEEEDRKTAALLQEEQRRLALEEEKYKEQLEQERHDHELAVRLAQESNGQIEDSPPSSRRSVRFILIKIYLNAKFCTAFCLSV